tara:strand:+ start:48226 stop:48942 length:717 start_codon:yes stop_codon:yes gene_type:complete
MSLIWAVVIFAAVMRAFTGFGFALAAVPVFSLFMLPTEAVVLSAGLTLAVSLLTLKSYWGQYPLRPMLPMVGMSLLGTVVGAWALRHISPEQFKLWIGLAVIGACIALGFFKPRKREPAPLLGAPVGLGSGLLNGAFAIPGPPIIIYAMATENDPQRSRALLMTFFLFSAIVALASYATAGFITAYSPWLFALAFPAMFLGDKLGFYLFYRFGGAFYRRVALAMLFAVGMAITARALL